MAATSTLSRRISEFVGVLLFALALMWLIALATYNPADPAWFFNTGPGQPATNLAGRAGAFLAELSFQLVGYAAYLFPALVAVHRLVPLLVPGHRRAVSRRRSASRCSFASTVDVPRPRAWRRPARRA